MDSVGRGKNEADDAAEIRGSSPDIVIFLVPTVSESQMNPCPLGPWLFCEVPPIFSQLMPHFSRLSWFLLFVTKILSYYHCKNIKIAF